MPLSASRQMAAVVGVAMYWFAYICLCARRIGISLHTARRWQAAMGTCRCVLSVARTIKATPLPLRIEFRCNESAAKYATKSGNNGGKITSSISPIFHYRQHECASVCVCVCVYLSADEAVCADLRLCVLILLGPPNNCLLKSFSHTTKSMLSALWP